MTSIFEGQPPQDKAFSNQNKVIGVPGMYCFLEKDMFKFSEVYIIFVLFLVEF